MSIIQSTGGSLLTGGVVMPNDDGDTVMPGTGGAVISGGKLIEGGVARRTRHALYKLTLTAGSGGSAALSPIGPRYGAGTVVTATAVPNDGYVFDGWTLDDTPIEENPTTVTMDAAHTVAAAFSDISGYLVYDDFPADGLLADSVAETGQAWQTTYVESEGTSDASVSAGVVLTHNSLAYIDAETADVDIRLAVTDVTDGVEILFWLHLDEEDLSNSVFARLLVTAESWAVEFSDGAFGTHTLASGVLDLSAVVALRVLVRGLHVRAYADDILLLEDTISEDDNPYQSTLMGFRTDPAGDSGVTFFTIASPPPVHVLTITTLPEGEDAGTIDPFTGTSWFDGTVVEASVQALDGWAFVSASIDDGPPITETPFDITMDDDHTVVVTFEASP